MAAVDVTQAGFGEPASNGEAVTPHDSNTLTYVSRALYVGGAGDVAVILLGGQTLTFSAVPAGTILPVRAKQVKSTGTTATLILSLY
jgi:hypothetical protein